MRWPAPAGAGAGGRRWTLRGNTEIRRFYNIYPTAKHGQCLGLIFSLLQPIINESFLCWIRRYVCSVKFCIDRDWYWYACIKLPLLHCEEQIIFMHIEVKHQISSFDGSCHCHCILFSRLWKIVIIWGKINVWKKIKVFSDRTAGADIANNRVCMCTVTGCGGCSINHTSPIRPISQDTSQYRGGNVLYNGPH